MEVMSSYPSVSLCYSSSSPSHLHRAVIQEVGPWASKTFRSHSLPKYLFQYHGFKFHLESNGARVYNYSSDLHLNSSLYILLDVTTPTCMSNWHFKMSKSDLICLRPDSLLSASGNSISPVAQAKTTVVNMDSFLLI